ncbi:MAG: MmgE/PrpD family protein [Patescibacteria group bacterium]
MRELKNILDIIVKYTLSEDKTFLKEDFEVAKVLIANAKREIALFKKGNECKKIEKVLDTKSLSNRAFINSYGIHHRDFDEMSFSIGGHPTATILPILLAFHKSNNVNLFLQAIKLEIVLGQILNPELYRSQYHSTTVIGILGSAAISAKLLKLTPEQAINALSIAFSFLSGIKSSFGSSAKSLQVAHATQQGLLAALYSRQGFTANVDLLGRNNVLYLFTGKRINLRYVNELWGKLSCHLSLKDEFLIKKYDVCGSFHSIITTALGDRDKFLQSINNIKKVIILIHPERIKYKTISFPKNSAQKKFCPVYLYAYVFLGNNPLTISDFDSVPESVKVFMKKISLIADRRIEKWGCKTKIIKGVKV